MNAVIFRGITEQDYEDICHLFKNEDELFLVYPKGTYPLTPDQIDQLSESRYELTVAVLGDSIIGFANLYDYVPRTSAFIGNVIIDQQHRGKGIGKTIITYMLNIVFYKLCLSEIRVSVFSENTPALLLYSSCGFRPYGIEERKTRHGKRLALLHMKMQRPD